MIRLCYQRVAVKQLTCDPLFHFYSTVGSDRLDESITKEKINISRQCLQVHLLVKQGLFLMIQCLELVSFGIFQGCLSSVACHGHN